MDPLTRTLRRCTIALFLVSAFAALYVAQRSIAFASPSAATNAAHVSR